MIFIMTGDKETIKQLLDSVKLLTQTVKILELRVENLENREVVSESDENQEKAKKTKKPKKVKKVDDGKPKKPLTSYMIFCSTERAKVKEDNPDINTRQVLQELGKRWRNVDEDTKNSLDEEYKRRKEQYAKDMEEYENNKN